jgi:hypothetical protein
MMRLWLGGTQQWLPRKLDAAPGIATKDVTVQRGTRNEELLNTRVA